MYIKPFKPKHLNAIIAWMPHYPYPCSRLGWVVIEDAVILAVGFFREIEGGRMAALEGPYLVPDSKRAMEAGEMLSKFFMSEALDRNVNLYRLKPYRP